MSLSPCTSMPSATVGPEPRRASARRAVPARGHAAGEGQAPLGQDGVAATPRDLRGGVASGHRRLPAGISRHWRGWVGCNVFACECIDIEICLELCIGAQNRYLCTVCWVLIVVKSSTRYSSIFCNVLEKYLPPGGICFFCSVGHVFH